jgi:hypothetical protein
MTQTYLFIPDNYELIQRIRMLSLIKPILILAGTPALNSCLAILF